MVIAVSSTEQPRRCPSWEAAVAWKPWEAAEGTKATFILGAGRQGLAAGPWDRGRAPGFLPFPGGFPLAGTVAFGRVPDSLANFP